MVHSRGIPATHNGPPAPFCNLRGQGETTTLLHAITCPGCRKILRLDGVEWGAPKPDRKLEPASRDFLDRKREAGADK